jgi:hypothetical protein
MATNTATGAVPPAAASTPPRAADHTVIGWTGSGKTALIATVLSKAGSCYPQSVLEPSFEWDAPKPGVPASEASGAQQKEMDALRRQLDAATYNGGEFLATSTKVHTYRFDMRIGRTDPFHGPTTHAFSMVDGGGELLMPPPKGDDFDPSNQHYVALSQAKGVILCIPSYRLPEEHAYWTWVDQVLVWLNRPSSRLERLVVCLTKYEHRTAGEGSGARDKADKEDFFVESIRQAVPPNTRQRLGALAYGKAKVAITPVSVYGFVADNGCANYDPFHPKQRGGMLLQRAIPDGAEASGTRPWPLYDPDEVLQRWQPYRIIEPFLYLATGRGGSLTLPWEHVRRLLPQTPGGGR